MKKSHPGRFERQGMSLVELIELFPDNASAEAWYPRHLPPVERKAPEPLRSGILRTAQHP